MSAGVSAFEESLSRAVVWGSLCDKTLHADPRLAEACIDAGRSAVPGSGKQLALALC